MKTTILLTFLLLAINGCSDFSSESNEFDLSGKHYACDGDSYGEIINDTKAGKKQYCNGYRWIDLIPEDSIIKITPESNDSISMMYECENGSIVKNKDLCSENPKDYLPLDDTEYPYAGLPRIVIETENLQEIKDRETEIPAKLQIWGDSSPESEILELTIRGRGNTSWFGTPKRSYKIKFETKSEILGMPSNTDWALIANYADKSLIKNHLVYSLSAQLKSYYSPRSRLIELYVNKLYLGVYLLTETIKVGKHRVNIPKSDFSYLVEIDGKHKEGEIFFVSKGIDETGRPFRIHEPSNPSTASMDTIKNYINSFEVFLRDSPNKTINEINKWINLDEAIKHYWIQELTKNPDANFYTSVYFNWEKGNSIKLGPVWDFDLSMGGHSSDSVNATDEWYIRHYWYRHLFRNKEFQTKAWAYWKKNKAIFESMISQIDSLQKDMQLAANNNFNRWNILGSTRYQYHPQSFETYKDATEYLKNWIYNRIQWIDKQYDSSK